MDAPYQARDDTALMWAGSGGVSIRGMMPRKSVEVKRQLHGSLTKRLKEPSGQSLRDYGSSGAGAGSPVEIFIVINEVA
jgi:hypothetical protein